MGVALTDRLLKMILLLHLLFLLKNLFFFIIGIVKVPVVTVFAIEDPEIKPVIPDPKIAALAGPPLIFPTIAKAKSKKYFPPPAVSRSAPNKKKKKKKNFSPPPFLKKGPKKKKKKKKKS